LAARFAEVTGNIVAEAPDGIGQHGIRARIALRQAQQRCSGNERNPVIARAVNPGDDRDTVSARRHQSMSSNPNARLFGKCQRKDFTRRNVMRIIRIGKPGKGERQSSLRMSPSELTRKCPLLLISRFDCFLGG
jgi:hypothetical protein